MYATFIAICGLIILLGFEIRHREVVEQLNKLKDATNILDEEVLRLKEEVKMKQNIYEEHNPPK